MALVTEPVAKSAPRLFAATYTTSAPVKKDAPGIQRYVRKTALMVDAAYQRTASPEKVKEIAKNWSWVSCGSICVSERPDGTYAVYDGQHRVLAAMMRDDIVHLPCIVFKLDDVADEARGFLGANVGRKPISTSAKFNAMAVAGDPVAMKVSRAITASGYKVGSSGAATPGVVSCIGAVIDMYRGDPDSADAIWAQVVTVAGGEHIGWALFTGLRYLAASTRGVSLEPRWTKRLAEIGPAKLVKATDDAALYYGKRNPTSCAKGIFRRVNERVREKLTWPGDASDLD